MRLSEVKKAIFVGLRPKGYRVHFERLEGQILTTDYFPEGEEPMFEHEEEAWSGHGNSPQLLSVKM